MVMDSGSRLYSVQPVSQNDQPLPGLEKGENNLEILSAMHAKSLPAGELLEVAVAEAAKAMYDDQCQELLSSSFQPERTSLLLASLHHQHHHLEFSNNNATPSPHGTSEQINSPHDGTFTLSSSSITSLRRRVGQTYSKENSTGDSSTTTKGQTTTSDVTSTPAPTATDFPSFPPNNDKSFKDKVSKKVDFDIPPSPQGDMESTKTTTATATTNQNEVIGVESAENENHENEPKKSPRAGQGITSSSPEDTRKGGHSSSNGRRSRSPGGNIMREIRKMSLASQDARDEKKKKKEDAATTPAAESGSSGAPGGGPSPSGAGGGGKVSKRQARRRKRKEEEYTDKDRAAAVTLGSRDIKQSLKAKKKRERKLRISVDLLHNEEFLSGMLVVEAAYQMRVKRQTKEALTTLNKALELQPTHKGALVARSQCHLKLGDAGAALRDAEASFEGNDGYIMGLYQYAESLYNLGQFEKALIAYHRGYRTRKLESFRIGIQKSQDAIQRAIGDCRTTAMEDLDEILPLIDELEVSTILRTSRSGSSGNNVPTSDLPLNKQQPNVPTMTATAPAATPSATAAATVSQTGQFKLRLGSSGTGEKSRSDNANDSRARWIAREVLGQMYFDKDYLTRFLSRKDIQSDHGASHQLRTNATEALNYLETREQFWRQQNPMYTRKQGLSNNNKNRPRKQEASKQNSRLCDQTDASDSSGHQNNLPLLVAATARKNGAPERQKSTERKDSTSGVSQNPKQTPSSVVPLVLVNATNEGSGSKSGSASNKSRRTKVL